MEYIVNTKITIIILLLFLTLTVILDIITSITFTTYAVVGSSLTYIAWLADKKEKVRIKKLKQRQLERMARWEELYMYTPRSKRNKATKN